jgi:hypothetical protein
VSPDPDELLLQADGLVGKAGATETDFRRAISAAYYAVFHFCLTCAADMVSGAASRSTPRYCVVYRSIDHKALRGLCGQLTQSKSHNVAIIPSTGFGSLQDFARVTANLARISHTKLKNSRPEPSMVHCLTGWLAGHFAGKRSRGVTRREQRDFFLIWCEVSV